MGLVTGQQVFTSRHLKHSNECKADQKREMNLPGCFILASTPKLIDESFLVSVQPWRLGVGLCVIMIICIYFGRRLGLWRLKNSTEKDETSSSTAMSAMMGLLAFILAFTFGMSSGRFDARRTVIVNEANAIGTALLRADLYPEPHRTALRNDFEKYLEARILYYEYKAEIDYVYGARAAAKVIGGRLWKRVTDLSKQPAFELESRLMVPALNDMFDLSTTRLIGELARVPNSIVWMLFVLSWTSAFFLGYMSARKGPIDWYLTTGFCVLTSVVIYITLDIDRPRRGFIQLNTSHNAMLELRENFRTE